MKFDDLVILLESQEELEIKKTFYDKAETKPRITFYRNKDGNPHRLDGPAYQGWHKNGQKAYESWYINGINYTKKEFDEYIKGLDKDQLEMLGDLGQTFE